MKKLRKVLALVLAMVMVLGMSTMTAFAANSKDTTGSITITNPQDGQNYTAYRIFDVSYSDSAKNTYGILASADVYNMLKDRTDLVTFDSTPTNNGEYIVKEVKSAAELAKFLSGTTIPSSVPSVPFTGTTEKVATNIPIGYYFVKSTTGALCNLTPTNPNASIVDKNEIPVIEKTKETSGDTFDVGSIIEYKITGTIPDTTGYSSYTYTISDKMTNLTYASDFKVTVGGTEIAVTSPTVGATSFTVTLEATDYTAGAAVVVSYKAKLTEGAIAGAGTNEATLTYSNDPTSTNTGTTAPVEVKVYSNKITVNKYDSTNNGTASSDGHSTLAGAKFVLKNSEGKYYFWNEQESKVEWKGLETVPTEDATNVTIVTTTNEEDIFNTFEGLADGTYTLVEIKAPDGYNKLNVNENPEVEVQHTVNADKTEVGVNVIKPIGNSKGATLPSTGGMGTTLFYVFGAILVIGAGIVLVARRRMAK